MKKNLGIIALMAIIGFSMAACDDGIDNGSGGNGINNGGGGIASGMETLSLSGRVYLENWNDDATSVTYSNYTGGNLTIDDYGLGGSGTVTNGNLSYSVGTPGNLYTLDQEDVEDFFWGYDISLNRENVQGFVLYDLGITNAEGYLYKSSTAINLSNNSFTYTGDGVTYVYVDNDITITGTGGTEGPHTETWDETTYTETYIRRNFNLALKAGWNAVYQKMENSGTFTGTIENPTSMTITSTTTVSLSNPSLRWVLSGYVPPATIPPASHTPLSFNTWANGNITSSVRELYFSFIATANQHYIHFGSGALDDVNVEIYNSSGSRVGNRENLYGSYLSSSWDLTSGQTYYIRVLPYYSSDSGSFQIAFNSSWTAPFVASLSVTPSFSIIVPDTVLEKTKKERTEIPKIYTLRQTGLNRK